MLFASVAFPSHAARQPFVVSQDYQERLHTNRTAQAPEGTCRLRFERVEDGRRDSSTLGNVAKRQVRSPPDPIAWVQSALSGLRYRGIEVRFEQLPAEEGGALVASARLLVAWVSNIQANKSANVAMRIQVRRDADIVLERDYRGVETTVNFVSGDRELQKVIDTAFGRLLDSLAPDLLTVCAP